MSCRLRTSYLPAAGDLLVAYFTALPLYPYDLVQVTPFRAVFKRGKTGGGAFGGNWQQNRTKLTVTLQPTADEHIEWSFNYEFGALLSVLFVDEHAVPRMRDLLEAEALGFRNYYMQFLNAQFLQELGENLARAVVQCSQDFGPALLTLLGGTPTVLARELLVFFSWIASLRVRQDAPQEHIRPILDAMHLSLLSLPILVECPEARLFVQGRHNTYDAAFVTHPGAIGFRAAGTRFASICNPDATDPIPWPQDPDEMGEDAGIWTRMGSLLMAINPLLKSIPKT